MKSFYVKNLMKKIWRKPYQLYLRSQLENHEFSIISSNCIGGILSHDLGEQFRSPTINLTIREYLEFVKNLPYYISLTPTNEGYDKHGGYPICKLDNVHICGVHYDSHDEMILNWEKRKKRINWNNIFLITTDEYVNTTEDLKQFSKLPYAKVLFTKDNNIMYDFQVHIPGFEDQECVGDVLRYADIFGTRKFEKYFDCVKWLNSNMTRKSIQKLVKNGLKEEENE